MEQTLNGNWKVNHIDCGAAVEEFLKPDFVPEGWLAAQVPEDIHATLRRAGFLRGHVYNKEADEEEWVEKRDWVYLREFYLGKEWEGERIQLLCEGLDTFCDLYVNGSWIGSSRNMHIEWSREISSLLHFGGRNVLLIRFHSAADFVKDWDQKGIFSITTSDRIFARKAQMNYGWDFCGRTVTLGIWKNVMLRRVEETRIADFHVWTERITDRRAWVALETKLEGARECELQASLSWKGKIVWEQSLPAGEAEQLCMEIPDPLLWWPRPYGGQPLYDLKLSLKKEGHVCDVRRQKLGIRTIEVVQEAQADGISFQFVVNGRRLFIRGANWVPMQVIYTDIREMDYERYLEFAVRGNLSMLRVWGGGIYEHPHFYECCDRLGLLVWNDFMFACGIYPQNEDFLEEVRREAEEIVRKYRNYTCLAIWAGDNENGQAFGWAGRDYEFQNDRIGNQVLKQACLELDPGRCYIPTSPCSPHENARGGDNPSSPYQGDQHIYIMSANPGVNAYRDYGKDYYKRILGIRPRFMSEFGFVSLPEKDSFYRYNFRREAIRNKKEMVSFLPSIEKYMDNCDFDKAIYYSQLFNSMALKYWIEYFRSLKGTCWGSLYWKFNDPLADNPEDYLFPSHMCAVDMYGKTKMTYYYTKRAYEDVILSFIEQEDGLAVYACSELLEEKKGRLILECLDFLGNVKWRREAERTIPADCAAKLFTIASEELEGGRPEGEYLKAAFEAGTEIYENRYFFLDLNENDRMELPDAALSLVWGSWTDGQIRIRLSARCFARSVRLNILDTEAYYSDNYFDMDAGSTQEITVTLGDGGTAEELKEKLLYVEAANSRRFAVELCGCYCSQQPQTPAV